MRPMTLLLTLTAFAALVVGCAARPGTALAPTIALPATATTDPPTPEPSPTTDSPRATITLRLWLPEELDPYDRTRSRGYLIRQLASFTNSHPDLAVEVVVKAVHGRGGMLDFLRTVPEVAPSLLPDLMIIDAGDLRETAGANLIQPLDDLLSPSFVNDRYDFATEMGAVGEDTMGFVLGVRAEHQAYRTDAFTDPPLNWTDVISAPGQFIFPAGARGGEINDATLMQYLGAGGTLTDRDGNPWIDRSALVQVFSFYGSCMTSGVISPTVVLSTGDSTQAWERFRSEGAAITLVDAGIYRRGADETTAAAPAPTRYSQPIAVARGWVITLVPQDPARQALAMLLLDWLISSEQNAAWTRAEGYLPGTRSAVMFWEAPEGERVMLGELLDATVPAPPREVMARIGPGMQLGLEALLVGRASAVQAAGIALDAIQQ